ncbi:lipopolysaccharide assembly protein LapA domain-containing protein [Sphaerisporangium aureirubrum]|uniref:Lipopolysaccharide assembly protein LapA domain-containing protein n=1 Tax=Sphaerisporangium aureirubrum TaxID=1544736 RepID=A0ABW1NRX1_9ACTN
MDLPRRSPPKPLAPAEITGPGPEAPIAPPAPPAGPLPVTRTSVAWAGVWTAAAVAIAFIVFMLQNTASAQVSFLGLHGTLPLAIALLIALVTGILLTLVLGTARITQLRRLARANRRGQGR